jgi:molybdopterin-guanine dinucleotide biosynthesis protein MobB
MDVARQHPVPPVSHHGIDHALVLAGPGRDGADRRLLTLDGRPLLLRAVDFVRSRFGHVAVAMPAARALDLADVAPDVRVLAGDAGSSALAGLADGLRALSAPLLAMDAALPFPDLSALDRLLSVWDGDADACLPSVDGALKPLFGLYDPRCLPALAASLAAGRHDIAAALEDLRIVTVPFPNDHAFTPVESSADCEQIRRQSAPDRPVFAGPVAGPSRPALVAIVGKSDAGKTTVVERLLPELQRLGLRVGTVKHDAHDFQIDHPGTDSFRHGAAGAPAYVVASPHRLAFVTLLDEELPLTEIVRRFYPGYDLVLAEGYKRQAPYRVEVFREAAGHPEPLCATEDMLAVLSDTQVSHAWRFDLDDTDGLAAFIVLRLDLLRRY